MDFLLEAEAELDSKAIEIRISILQLVAAVVTLLAIIGGALGTLWLRFEMLRARVTILEHLHEGGP
jgi:hypothetical protein